MRYACTYFGMSRVWNDMEYWWECYKDRQGPDFWEQVCHAKEFGFYSGDVGDQYRGWIGVLNQYRGWTGETEERPINRRP